MSFIVLNARSAFSFLYGAYHPGELVARAAERALGGVVLADRWGLYGMVRLARAARDARLYALCGAEVGFVEGGALVLLPRDEAGHASLAALLTRGHLENPRGRPQAHLAWLAATEGLAGLVPGRRLLGLGARWLKRLAAVFPGPLLMGLPGAEVSAAQRDWLRGLAAGLGITVAAAPEVVALDQAGYRTHRSLTAIARAVHHRDEPPLPPGSGVLPGPAEMRAFFSAAEIRATWRVLELCPFELPLGRRWLPTYPLPRGRTPQKELAGRCLKSLARRGAVRQHYLKRLDRELAAINRFGYADYFLLVSDLVEFARGRGIRCTVRGSAAGSMVTWLLCGGVDPVEYDLLFERFMNEGRLEPPDVDLDFDSLRRDEVLSHLMARFPGRAAMVATVPTFRARSAVRELCLALGRGQAEAGRLTDFLPHYARASRLPVLLETTPELAGHPLAREKRLLELAAGISGLPRQLSVHLGGVALGPLEKLVPLEMTAQDLKVIQLDKDDTEDLGLIKLDLLGLRMHTACAGSLEMLQARGVEVDLDRLDLGDQKVYDLMCTTDTVGVFQVESPGQRGLLGRLQPRNFNDLMIEISLFRPGPMQADMVTPFVQRRWGEIPVAYPHPLLEPVMNDTLGVLVFQEQVLKIAHHLAGLSYGQADGLRRAMTHHRSPAEMAKLRDSFLEGCRGRGVDEGVGMMLWEQVASFAAYGFCKAHAASFAAITFQSAWLKAHHPLEFFLGLLNAGHVGGYCARTLLNEARRWGLGILGPDVNHSRSGFSPENGFIRVGLLPIRNIGPAAVDKILSARERGGPFTSREDFAGRTKLTRRQIRTLEQSGALTLAWRQLSLFGDLAGEAPCPIPG